MRNVLLFCFASLLVADASGQYTKVVDTHAVWTWVTGQSTTSDRGAGTQGAPSTSARMSARREVALWCDDLGNMWFFGGGFNTNQNTLNDMWKFNPSSREWTWVRGPFSPTTDNGFGQGGTYKTKGTPHPDNWPGGRRISHSWKDKDGKFWFFGGAGNTTQSGRTTTTQGHLNDMWMLDPATGYWTWVHGDSTINAEGEYGIVGQGTGTTRPAGRVHSCLWVAKDGKVWLFGGNTRVAGNNGRTSDMWVYDPQTNIWTWVAGTTQLDATGNWGQREVPASTNYPSAREAAFHWTDKDGNFWMFGGYGPDNTGTPGRLGDLWKFDPNTRMWVWMHGPATREEAGVYGDKGVPNSANQPSARSTGPLKEGWVDEYGGLWLYGGYGIANGSGNYMEDMWRYDPANNQWAWMGGKMNAQLQVPAFGTLGTPAKTNHPGSRGAYGSLVDDEGNIWLFGGWGVAGVSVAPRGDLWVLKPDPKTPPATPGAFTAIKNAVCPGETNVTYSVPAVTGAGYYEWTYTGSGVTYNATTFAPSNVLSFGANASGGTLRVRAVNTAGQSAWRETTITISPLPTVTVSPSGNVTICQGASQQLTANATPAGSYQWLQGTTPVGSNSDKYSVTAAGAYRVVVTTSGGCVDTSTAVTVAVTPLPNISISPSQVSICEGQTATLTASGGATYSWSPSGGNQAVANVAPLTSTTYTVTGTQNGCSNTATAQVTVNLLPTINVSGAGPQEICEGDSLILTASGTVGVSYEWKYNGVTAGTGSSFAAKAAGIYTVTGTVTATGCSITPAPGTTLTVHPRPVAALAAGGPTDICAGSVVSLTTTTTGGLSYKWWRNGVNLGTSANAYDADVTGAYTVVVTNTTTGCSDSSAAIYVRVYERPRVSLTPSDTAFCEGGVVILQTHSQDTGLTYAWKNGSNSISQASAHFLEVSESGIYTVVVGYANVQNCDTVTNEARITVYPQPTVAIVWDGHTLHATTGYKSYQWYVGGQGIPGATDSVYTPTTSGGFSVAVADDHDCTNNSPVYNVTVGVDEISSPISQVRIYPNPTNGIVYINSEMPLRAVVMSVEGKVLLEQNDAKEINLARYPAGVYALRLFDANNICIRYEKIFRQ